MPARKWVATRPTSEGGVLLEHIRVSPTDTRFILQLHKDGVIESCQRGWYVAA
jgi:hypothetical protein